jgi:hypothetical protein
MEARNDNRLTIHACLGPLLRNPSPDMRPAVLSANFPSSFSEKAAVKMANLKLDYLRPYSIEADIC